MRKPGHFLRRGGRVIRKREPTLGSIAKLNPEELEKLIEAGAKKTAFEKIEEGLMEALSVAKTEKKE